MLTDTMVEARIRSLRAAGQTGLKKPPGEEKAKEVEGVVEGDAPVATSFPIARLESDVRRATQEYHRLTASIHVLEQARQRVMLDEARVGKKAAFWRTQMEAASLVQAEAA